MSISHVFTPLIKKSSCQRPQKGQEELSKSRDLLHRSITSGVATDLLCSAGVLLVWSMLWSQTAPYDETAKLVSPPQRSVNVQSDVHQARANHRRGQSQVITETSALPLPSNRAVVSHSIKARSKRWLVGCHRSPLLRSSSSSWSPTHRVHQARVG